MTREDIAVRMEWKAEVLRAIAALPILNPLGKELFSSCADLYDMRALNLRSSRRAG